MNSKRGRPKGPDKVVFKKRLTPAQAETLELIWPRLVEGGFTREEAEELMALSPMAVEEVVVDVKAAIVKSPSINVPPSKEAHDVSQYLTEISQLRAEVDYLMGELGVAKLAVKPIDNWELEGLRKENQRMKDKIKQMETYS